MSIIQTRAFGLKTPIIREGDDVIGIAIETLKKAQRKWWNPWSYLNGIAFKDKDVLGITEAVVGRAQGNYATVDDIAKEVRAKFPTGTVGVLFPILSRNRFAMILQGIARGAERVVVQLSFPADEVGNELLDSCAIDDLSADHTEESFVQKFGKPRHVFTGIDYIEHYKGLGGNIEIILSNHPARILGHTRQVIVADIHNRFKTEKKLRDCEPGATVYRLDQFMNCRNRDTGYNEEYGLLGSNKADEERIKLFPVGCKEMVVELQRRIHKEFKVSMEVLVFGDGCFKDSVGGIWELADPVVCVAFTDGLRGKKNEIKLKYIADGKFGHLRGEEQQRAVVQAIREKDNDLLGKMEAEGTTPRRLCDLLGSLFDLICGSGDKGTPLVLVQGYFDNFATGE